MNILFLTTQFPYPLDNGGKIGAFNGISVVSRDFDVTVLSFTEEPQYIYEGLEYYKKILPSVRFENPIVHDIHIRKSMKKVFSAILGGYIKKLPYIVSKFDDIKMYKKIDCKFENGKKWDFVFIDYLNMNVYGEYIRNKYSNLVGQFIFKDHNIEYELVKQEAISSSNIKKIVLELEWRRTYLYEKKAVKKADIVFSVCNSNTEWLKKINNNTWTMYPTYKMLPSRKMINGSKSILYMGNLSWKSNMDGLVWFINEVFPAVRKKVPEARLTIVGSGHIDDAVLRMENIDFLGYVKDITSIYDDQKVFIVPLFEGSGIRIKILEAFNNEIAVVSTSLGCDTIGVEHGNHLVKADSAVDFANAVIILLEDDELNEKMRFFGKLFLKEHFSITKCQDEFATIMFPDCIPPMNL